MSQPTLELADTGQLTQYRAGDAGLMLAAAEAAVRGYCGWHIAPSRTEDVTVNGSGAQILPLPTMHLTAVESVEEDGNDIDPLSMQWSSAGYLWRGGAWTTTLRGVVATITHGYEDVPAEVQAVVLSVAARAQASPGGERTDQAGPFRVTLATNEDGTAGGVILSRLEQAALDRYRLP